ncbi:hypothetical protein AAMO2058_000263600 [Amorphochlora amoebiformis]
MFSDERRDPYQRAYEYCKLLYERNKANPIFLKRTSKLYNGSWLSARRPVPVPRGCLGIDDILPLREAQLPLSPRGLTKTLCVQINSLSLSISQPFPSSHSSSKASVMVLICLMRGDVRLEAKQHSILMVCDDLNGKLLSGSEDVSSITDVKFDYDFFCEQDPRRNHKGSPLKIKFQLEIKSSGENLEFEVSLQRTNKEILTGNVSKALGGLIGNQHQTVTLFAQRNADNKVVFQEIGTASLSLAWTANLKDANSFTLASPNNLKHPPEIHTTMPLQTLKMMVNGLPKVNHRHWLHKGTENESKRDYWLEGFTCGWCPTTLKTLPALLCHMYCSHHPIIRFQYRRISETDYLIETRLCKAFLANIKQDVKHLHRNAVFYKDLPRWIDLVMSRVAHKGNFGVEYSPSEPPSKSPSNKPPSRRSVQTGFMSPESDLELPNSAPPGRKPPREDKLEQGLVSRYSLLSSSDGYSRSSPQALGGREYFHSTDISLADPQRIGNDSDDDDNVDDSWRRKQDKQRIEQYDDASPGQKLFFARWNEFLAHINLSGRNIQIIIFFLTVLFIFSFFHFFEFFSFGSL